MNLLPFVIFVTLVACSGLRAEDAMIANIKKTVVFVYAKDSKGNLVPKGTAFLVAVKSENDQNKLYFYTVTAKHVLADADDHYYPEISFRANKSDGTSQIVAIPLSGQHPVPILLHRDKTVDIAVLPTGPRTEEYDVKYIPIEMVTTKETFRQLRIQEGDDVFFGGLFTPFPGAKKNIPILRFGKVAMISDEKIPWENERLDLYLMETQSFGGNSGAAVFFNLSPLRTPGTIVAGGPQLYLAGVMKGSFLNGSELRAINRSAVPVSVENTGIAAIVPSYFLHDILFGAEAKKLRDEAKK